MLTRATSQLIRHSLTRRVRLFQDPKHSLVATHNRLISSTSISSVTFNPQNFPLATQAGEQEVEDVVNNQEETSAESQDSVPWFLRTEESSTLAAPIFKAEMPAIPENCPVFVQPLMQSLIDLGLDELKVFDLRGREEELPMAQHTDFAVVCQGKSPKHIQNAAEALVELLKKEHGVIPFAEGLIKPNSTMRMKRKLKQKKPLNDFGLGVNSWVMVDSQLGLVINMMTPERRKQINLEYMWCTPEERPQYEQSSLMSTTEDDSIFSGIFRRHYSTTPHDVPLEVKAEQCFQIGDIETFETEVLPYIRRSPEKSLSVLENIVQDLKNSDIDTFIFESPDIKSDLTFKFITSCFPSNPTREHWQKRFEALEVLSAIFPMEKRFRHLTTTLLLQASSGIPITTEQLVVFTEALSRNLFYNSPSHIYSQNEVNKFSSYKLEQFSAILETFTAEHRGSLPDDVILGVLKLATQQHLYLRTDEIIPVSSVFDVLLEIFAERTPSLNTVEFVLVTYLKANEVDKFWAFWNGLHKYTYSTDTATATLDSRPWSVLCDLLARNVHDKVVAELLNRKLPDALDLGLPITEDLKESVTTILDRFDESGLAYKHLRERFSTL